MTAGGVEGKDVSPGAGINPDLFASLREAQKKNEGWTFYLPDPMGAPGQPRSWDCNYCYRPQADHRADGRCPIPGCTLQGPPPIGEAPAPMPFLEKVAGVSKKALGVMQKHGFVIDNLEDRWQKLTFTLYSDLVEISAAAQEILDERSESAEAKPEPSKPFDGTAYYASLTSEGSSPEPGPGISFSNSKKPEIIQPRESPAGRECWALWDSAAGRFRDWCNINVLPGVPDYRGEWVRMVPAVEPPGAPRTVRDYFARAITEGHGIHVTPGAPQNYTMAAQPSKIENAIATTLRIFGPMTAQEAAGKIMQCLLAGRYLIEGPGAPAADLEACPNGHPDCTEVTGSTAKCLVCGIVFSPGAQGEGP